MDNEERIPGVTFRVEEATIAAHKGGMKDVVADGKVVLLAEITDLTTWKEAVDKLRNLRIYVVEDLTTELIEIAQERTATLECALRDLRAEKDAEIASLKQSLSFAEAMAAQRRVAAPSAPKDTYTNVARFIAECDELLRGNGRG